MFEFLWFLFYIYCVFLCFIFGVVIFLYLLYILFAFLFALILAIAEIIKGIFYLLAEITMFTIDFTKTICYKAFYYLSKFIKFAYQKIKSKK
jgi:hypothetical protein